MLLPTAKLAIYLPANYNPVVKTCKSCTIIKQILYNEKIASSKSSGHSLNPRNHIIVTQFIKFIYLCRFVTYFLGYTYSVFKRPRSRTIYILGLLLPTNYTLFKLIMF